MDQDCLAAAPSNEDQQKWQEAQRQLKQQLEFERHQKDENGVSRAMIDRFVGIIGEGLSTGETDMRALVYCGIRELLKHELSDRPQTVMLEPAFIDILNVMRDMGDVRPSTAVIHGKLRNLRGFYAVAGPEYVQAVLQVMAERGLVIQNHPPAGKTWRLNLPPPAEKRRVINDDDRIRLGSGRVVSGREFLEMTRRQSELLGEDQFFVLPDPPRSCSICGSHQFITESGYTCPNGHGGAPPKEGH